MNSINLFSSLKHKRCRVQRARPMLILDRKVEAGKRLEVKGNLCYKVSSRSA